MMRIFSLFARAWADAGHADGAAHAVVIPWSSLLTQTFNFVFLFALLVYLLRGTLAAHFGKRASDYDDLVKRAEAARTEAERAKKDIEARLNALEKDAGQSEAKARDEAERLRTKLTDEARELSAKLEREAAQTAALAIEKAKTELRRDLLDRALRGAGESMRTGLSQTQQKQLQTEFVDKIQVVGQ